MSIQYVQYAYLPHATSQANRSDRTAVLSAYTNYYDACLGTTATVPHASCQHLMGHAYTKVRAEPREETSLGTNSASPEPDLGYPLPANPVGGHSFNCVVHVYESWSGLDHDLG
jgi:hypothetical protein